MTRTRHGTMLHWALGELLGTLPERRDWFNPDAEKVLRAAFSRASDPTATHGPLDLTNRKTAEIAGRGYNIVGYVLRREDGEEVCISAESAVRWLPQAHYWRLMHEQDGSLFGGPDAVTRESALAAIEHVESHNGPGRATEARAMLTTTG